MMKMDLIVLFVLIVLGSSINGDKIKNERDKAKIRARLANAKSIKEALSIIKKPRLMGRFGTLISPAELQKEIDKEEQKFLEDAEKFNTAINSTTPPSFGSCAPRIECKPVPIDDGLSDGAMIIPQCVEVHRCGGCCQDTQFPCRPVEELPVTFSPLALITFTDDGQQIQTHRPFTTTNHTKCECKCGKTQAQCRREGKKLDSILCQCIEPDCKPECHMSSKCSIVSVDNKFTEKCTCRHSISGTNNFCSGRNERPNRMCTACEKANG